VAVLAVNRSPSDDLTFEVDVRAFQPDQPDGGLRLAGHDVVADDDVRAKNTHQAPSRVTPQAHHGTTLADGCLTASLPPVSWSIIRLTPAAMT
jgi:alpha-N-arabinofuranosidase